MSEVSSSPVLALTQTLIARQSVTPDDQDCQQTLAAELADSGFVATHLPFEEVQNLWLRRNTAAPLLIFAGHTDVVPTGPLEQWDSNPFVPTIRDGKLYGRGAADMKSSIAAFTIAAKTFVQAHPDHRGSIAMLITSDEEGPSINGTVKVCEYLKQQGVQPDYCIVGEPTSTTTLGDVIKNGRRGSLSGRVVIKGLQGHVAYPHLARNPIHLCAPALHELASTEWDQGNEYFPPTTFQISNFHAGTGATNVVPGTAEFLFNIRFSTASTVESLKTRVQAILDAHHLESQIEWTLGGEPFLTPRGELSEALSAAIVAVTGTQTELSTTGGTSDGRFIAKICPQVIEFGPINATIHQINEHIEVDSLEPLAAIYRKTLENLLL
ncbi:succinyl-diaminopimelate desuccinylase [Advenella mimigardefordensis]|uniref:Succinyl-diaminopimelate desuccinylase n=1 Tax=Advenella mimigardefordensis (strain DSM 17166 / LMG 22922 / DPN7) TaxID=1247726 RepID=W0PAA9_ADVMD|nr:succinyl-diaminopimelate desuccinylase [Advenella mimigardefordensis]AHG63769.1 succinyl-diaminopimelate desuccinylase [Advenella mimigardefordensis DPN7]